MRAYVRACHKGTFTMKRWRTYQPKPISNHTNNSKQVCALRAYVRACHKGTCNMKRWRTSQHKARMSTRSSCTYNHSADETLKMTWLLTHLSTSKDSTFRKGPAEVPSAKLTGPSLSLVQRIQQASFSGPLPSYPPYARVRFCQGFV